MVKHGRRTSKSQFRSLGNLQDMYSPSNPSHYLECTIAGLEGQEVQNENLWDIFDRLESSNSQVS